jgi:hypothetical protein
LNLAASPPEHLIPKRNHKMRNKTKREIGDQFSSLRVYIKKKGLDPKKRGRKSVVLLIALKGQTQFQKFPHEGLSGCV